MPITPQRIDSHRVSANRTSWQAWRRGVALTFALLVALVAVATATARVQFKDSTHPPRALPNRIDMFAGAGAYFYYKHLRPWSNWGGSHATAHGVMHYNTCNPDCATGNYKTTRATVILSQVNRKCGGHRRYRHLRSRPKNPAVFEVSIHVTCRGFGR
jgi:hypothetical protein